MNEDEEDVGEGDNKSSTGSHKSSKLNLTTVNEKDLALAVEAYLDSKKCL